MLQVNIEHVGDSSVKILSLYNDNKLLESFDNEKGMINLDVCKPFLGEEIKVNHIFADQQERNYDIRAILQEVSVDPITKLKGIKFQTLKG